MGEHRISRGAGSQEIRKFTRKVLADLRALELMLDQGIVESNVRRIGAEQELFLVNKNWRPATNNLEVLEKIDDPRFTTELGKFNLEFNLDPFDLTSDCLRKMEGQLEELLTKARMAAEDLGVKILLTGILPTLEKSDLSLDNMTPMPRYFELNEAMTRLRGQDYDFRIKGRDELVLQHDNVMLEACNTSFQVHFQVSPERFANRYNIAQAVAAPVLAAATNSPLLFGRQLWRETRIALFQQSVDTRTPSTHLRELSPRVSFGRSWIKESALEIFQEDLARFRVIMSTEVSEDPFEALERGEAPRLDALRLHNGTIYRWNRPCYGVAGGKAHLRIENRVLPSGPTPLDEMANAAFWFGLIAGVGEKYGDITEHMTFEEARENFVKAARLGLGAQFDWVERKQVPARDLILEDLLPLSRDGLTHLGIDSVDSKRYLDVIERRVSSGRTASQWLLDSYVAMSETAGRAESLAALTAATCLRQETGEPVHEWQTAEPSEAGDKKKHYRRVDQVMVTDLFTVNQDDLVDIAAFVMDWRHIRHVPVEDDDHRLVGLVTHRSLLRILGGSVLSGIGSATSVGEIMQRDLVTVRPETTTLEAISLMREHRISCLPVVAESNRLVGIITEFDFMGIAGELLDKFLSESEPSDES
ncbi:MAG: CBS domain-containing protein [bacterium]|nr:CBS domain-containing protein [bacterium]